MAGMPELRQGIADKVAGLYGTRYDVDQEITVTAGATQALFTAIAAFVHPGDEGSSSTRSMTAMCRAIETVGGRAVHARLHLPDYRPDWDEVRALITPKTRMIIVNSPHSPTGSLLSADDLAALAAITRDTDIVLLSDEVHEHICFSGERRPRPPRRAGRRALIVSSFGKTYHITGWKVGYVVGPQALMREFRKGASVQRVHVNTPCQLVSPTTCATPRATSAGRLPAKRDFFRRAMQGSRFELLPCHGTYFQLARYDAISRQPDRTFAEWLTLEVGVAAIPVSVFNHDGRDAHVVRFCFAKKEETLAAAAKTVPCLSLGTPTGTNHDRSPAAAPAPVRRHRRAQLRARARTAQLPALAGRGHRLWHHAHADAGRHGRLRALAASTA